MDIHTSKLRLIAAGCALAGATLSASADDIDANLAAYRSAAAEATAIMAKITSGASAKYHDAALAAAMEKHRDAKAALNARTKKLRLSDKKDAERLQAALDAQRTATALMTAQQIRILQIQDAGAIAGKSFVDP